MENTFLKELEKQNNLTETQNGALTHKSTLDANLDLFSKSLRYLDESEIETLVIKSLGENSDLLLKNILHLLDIRGGKGERKAFKTIMAILSNKEKVAQGSEKDLISSIINTILKNIVELGRHDYWIDFTITEGLTDVFKKMYSANVDDLLMYKWMPSTRGARKGIAKAIQSILEISEKEYRQLLTSKRAELNLIETSLTNKDYDSIDLSKVPAKALSKYMEAINRNMRDALVEFNEKVSEGTVKINTTALYPYELLGKLNRYGSFDRIDENSEVVKLVENQWKNLKNFVPEGKSAIVVADTSGSMQGIPLLTSIGLGIYFSERNIGEWKDKLITFSKDPHFVDFSNCETLLDKLRVIPSIIENTDINKVFKLLMDTALKAGTEGMPEYLIIVSDMEFDDAEENKTNFEHWKDEFKKHLGIDLPKIVFWNASQYGNQSSPVTKNTENVSMVSGFSTAIFENLFNTEEFTPINNMIKILSKYDKYIE